MSQLSTEYKIEYIGDEKEPIIIIDNYSGQVDYLLSQAIAAHYSDPGISYPGVRANTASNYLLVRQKLLSNAIQQTFGFNDGISSASCSFSIVTTLPEMLSPAQRIPHYDDTSPDLLAALHYLKSDATGGTAFYKHRRTGFETITPERAKTYSEALREDDREYGPPEPGYIYGNNKRYKMTAEIPAKPDRLVIYRGRTLHSGVIPETFALTDDPLLGRVTMNTFLTRTK
jgi:hypothetical protein